MALVTTKYGDVDDTLLTRKDVQEVHTNGTAIATEYYDNTTNELVHRSVHFVFNQNAQPTPV